MFKFWKGSNGSPTSLNKIANQYGTDKGESGHFYTQHYENHFAKFRFEKIKLIEVGIFKGASIKLWESYFPSAKLSAIDINPDCRAFESARTQVFIGDQSNTGFLESVISETGAPDIIIDDGSHIQTHQLATFEFLFPKLKTGGIYVIEDLHTSYWKEYNDIGIVEFLKTLLDTVNLNGRSGWGDIRNDPEFKNIRKSLTPLEAAVDSIHFYKSIVFIIRK